MTENEPARRIEPPLAGTEAETLAGSLDRQRATFAWKTAGLGAETLAVTLGSSSITLGGLLKHLAGVEDIYFSWRLRGRDSGAPWNTVDWDNDGDWDRHSAADDSPEDLYRLWNDAAARSRISLAEALDDGCLDQLLPEAGGEVGSLRRMLIDVIEEYARHVGHADLIRESIDGLVGEDPPAQARNSGQPARAEHGRYVRPGRIQRYGTDEPRRTPLEDSAAQRPAAQTAPSPHRLVCAGSQDRIHPGAGMRMPASVEVNAAGGGGEREVLSDKRREFGTAKHHIPAGEQRIERVSTEFRCDGIQGLDGKQRDGSVHVGCLTEKPVTDDSLPGHYLRMLSIGGGDVGRTVPGAAKIGMTAGNEQVKDFDVVLVTHAFYVNVPRVALRIDSSHASCLPM